MKRLLLLLAVGVVGAAQFIPFPGPGVIAHSGGGGGVTFIQSPAVASSSSSVASESVSFSTLPIVGHTVHVMCASNGQANTFTATDNQGNTYTSAANAAVNGIFFFSAPVATSAGTFTVTCHPASSDYVSIGIAEFAGETATPTIDQSTHLASASTTTWSPGSIITTHASDVIISGCSSQTSAVFTYTPGSGYTILGSQTDGNNFVPVVWQYQIVTVTGTYTASFTVSPTGAPNCGVMAYEGQ